MDLSTLEFETILSEIYFQIENPDLDLESFFTEYEGPLATQKLLHYELDVLDKKFRLGISSEFDTTLLETCGICEEIFIDDSGLTIVKLPSCGCLYHFKCLMKPENNNNKCLKCKINVRSAILESLNSKSYTETILL
jgi:hypothetical protein